MGGFARGEIVEHVVLVLLGVFDPGRTARSKDGEFSSVLDAADDFGGFFDGGDFGAESSVVDSIEADFSHGGDHFAHDISAGFEAEFFAESDADSRGNLSDDDGVGVVNSRPDFVVIGVRNDGANGADGSAVPAVDAIDFGEGMVESRFDFGGLTAPCEA